ncbi:uncharacterized protein LOC119682784 [Teleopsis dalmanni]|uniref:uncharacterized protein LOC119682784 n=1 Tax=Teleopsis dalmanni TaxID=139649 RepID=UPI0018CDDE46|nr:uncharacterized protein LOC119682784 [Teleopsis dalmanni]
MLEKCTQIGSDQNKMTGKFEICEKAVEDLQDNLSRFLLNSAKYADFMYSYFQSGDTLLRPGGEHSPSISLSCALIAFNNYIKQMELVTEKVNTLNNYLIINSLQFNSIEEIFLPQFDSHFNNIAKVEVEIIDKNLQEIPQTVQIISNNEDIKKNELNSQIFVEYDKIDNVPEDNVHISEYVKNIDREKMEIARTQNYDNDTKENGIELDTLSCKSLTLKTLSTRISSSSSQNITSSTSSTTVIPPQDQYLDYSNLIVDSEFSGVVTFIENTELLSFYVQICNDHVYNLNTNMKLIPTDEPINTGDVFGIAMNERFILRARMEPDGKIQLIDFGDKIKLSRSFDHFELPKEYKEFPDSAVRCILTAVNDLCESTDKNILKHILNRMFFTLCDFEIINKTSTALYVKLLDMDLLSTLRNSEFSNAKSLVTEDSHDNDDKVSNNSFIMDHGIKEYQNLTKIKETLTAEKYENEIESEVFESPTCISSTCRETSDYEDQEIGTNQKLQQDKQNLELELQHAISSSTYKVSKQCTETTKNLSEKQAMDDNLQKNINSKQTKFSHEKDIEHEKTVKTEKRDEKFYDKSEGFISECGKNYTNTCPISPYRQQSIYSPLLFTIEDKYDQEIPDLNITKEEQCVPINKNLNEELSKYIKGISGIKEVICHDRNTDIVEDKNFDAIVKKNYSTRTDHKNTTSYCDEIKNIEIGCKSSNRTDYSVKNTTDDVPINSHTPYIKYKYRTNFKKKLNSSLQSYYQPIDDEIVKIRSRYCGREREKIIYPMHELKNFKKINKTVAKTATDSFGTYTNIIKDRHKKNYFSNIIKDNILIKYFHLSNTTCKNSDPYKNDNLRKRVTQIRNEVEEMQRSCNDEKFNFSSYLYQKDSIDNLNTDALHNLNSLKQPIKYYKDAKDKIDHRSQFRSTKTFKEEKYVDINHKSILYKNLPEKATRSAYYKFKTKQIKDSYCHSSSGMKKLTKLPQEKQRHSYAKPSHAKTKGSTVPHTRIVKKHTTLPQVETAQQIFPRDVLQENCIPFKKSRPRTEHVKFYIKSPIYMHRKLASRKPEIPKENNISVTVSSIIDVNRFYVQINQKATNQPKIWNNDDISVSRKLVKPPLLGKLVMAQYVLDKYWYRAIIKAIDEKRKLYEVFYVDYGLTDKVPLSCLAQCSARYAHLPFLALCCRFKRITSDMINVSRQKEAVEFLNVMFLNKIFIANMEYDGMEMVVDIADHSFPDIPSIMSTMGFITSLCHR